MLYEHFAVVISLFNEGMAWFDDRFTPPLLKPNNLGRKAKKRDLRGVLFAKEMRFAERLRNFVLCYILWEFMYVSKCAYVPVKW